MPNNDQRGQEGPQQQATCKYWPLLCPTDNMHGISQTLQILTILAAARPRCQGPTVRPSDEKEGEACCRNQRFPVCIPSPAESVLPFACPTPFARLESSFWPKRSFEESPLLLPIKAEQMILPSLFKIEQSLHSSATTLSFVRCPMMESSPYLSRPVIVQSRK